jgi:hypothetical protein
MFAELLAHVNGQASTPSPEIEEELVDDNEIAVSYDDYHSDSISSVSVSPSPSLESVSSNSEFVSLSTPTKLSNPSTSTPKSGSKSSGKSGWLPTSQKSSTVSTPTPAWANVNISKLIRAARPTPASTTTPLKPSMNSAHNSYGSINSSGANIYDKVNTSNTYIYETSLANFSNHISQSVSYIYTLILILLLNLCYHLLLLDNKTISTCTNT